MPTRTKRKATTDNRRSGKGKESGLRVRQSPAELPAGVPPKLGRYPNRWHDGFIIHSPGLLNDPKLQLGCLSMEQWSTAERMLTDGFVLALCANGVEAPAMAVACALQFRDPITVQYDEDDQVLYICNEQHALQRL